MGREIRRVPHDWEHPKNEKGKYIPLHDKDLETAKKLYNPEEYDGEPMCEETYRSRKWCEEEAKCFQVYETVSEGTPITPVFDNTEDLISYLTNNGDFWKNIWSKEAAENFIKRGW